MRLLLLMILAFSFTADASEDWKADCEALAANQYKVERKLEDNLLDNLAAESFAKNSYVCLTERDYGKLQAYAAGDMMAYSHWRMIVKMHHSRLEKKGRAFIKGN